MGKAVGGVVELIGPEPTFFLREALRHAVVVARILVRRFRHGDDFSLKGAQQTNLLGRLVVGDDDHDRIPFGVSDDR